MQRKMAGSSEKKETKITIEPEEQDLVALVYLHERITVQYEKLSIFGKTPCHSMPDAVGYDVFAAEDGIIPPNRRRKFKCDLATKPPPGFHLKLYNRSGLACDKGVFIPGSPMMIDHDFRGNVMVSLWNTNDTPYPVKKGDRIGQTMLERSYKIFWEYKRNLRYEKTECDPAGFGSSGH